MKQLFYVEMKNPAGKYEPLGVMTMAQAFDLSWAHGHATLNFEAVHDLSKATAR